MRRYMTQCTLRYNADAPMAQTVLRTYLLPDQQATEGQDVRAKFVTERTVTDMSISFGH